MIYSKKVSRGQFEDRWYVPLGNKTAKLTLDMLKESVVRIKTVEPRGYFGRVSYDDKVIQYMKKIDEKYENVKIRNVKKIEDTICISVDSKYCTNIRKDHTNNHVYFVIHKGMMYQKCFSRNKKSAGRLFCYCHEYKSNGVAVPHSVLSEFK